MLDAPHARLLVRVHGRLELAGVAHRYPGSERPALERVSLLVRPGRCVALVGASGAGKSTVAKLVVRFADPDAGSVRPDGHDLRDVTLRSLREHVALLLQDASLFDEPAAGRDAEATRRLLAPPRRLMSDRATLLITHYMALAAVADEVVELPGGGVVERGLAA